MRTHIDRKTPAPEVEIKKATAYIDNDGDFIVYVRDIIERLQASHIFATEAVRYSLVAYTVLHSKNKEILFTEGVIAVDSFKRDFTEFFGTISYTF